MKKLLCLAIVLSLSLLLIGAPVSADPGILYVDDDVGCGGNSPCYTTIQAAINAASPGDTIIVAPGTYNESLVIAKTLTLLGAQANVDPRPSVGGRSGPESIVVGGGGTDDLLIQTGGDEVVVNGFTFASKISSPSYNVVYAFRAKHPQILYNIVYNTNPTGYSNEGIKIRASGDTGGLVAYNYVYNIPSPGDAINFDAVNGGFISHNEVRHIGSENAAIYVYGSLSTTIKCNLVDTTTQNDGIKLGSKSGSDALKSGGSIVGNTVRNTKQDGISVYMSGVTVEANEITGSTSENGAIYVAFGVSNVTIKDNKVHHNTLNTGKWGNPGAIMIGTAVNASTVHVNNNNIHDNSPYGLTNKASALLDAENNWWGHASGPSGAGPGSGDAVSTNVDFTPWLEAPQIIVDPCVPPDSQGPITTDVVANPNPVAVGGPVLLTASVDDTTTGGSNITSAEYSLGDGAWVAMIAQDGSFDQASENVTASFAAPLVPGIYNLCVRGTDAAGNTGEAECIMLVVYDPSGGFVTGGGWIISPPGAYTLDPTATGKATFGFVSKYQKGANVPTGNTEFQFKAGNLNFKSTSYDWLVVAGARAQYKGTGTINGAGNYGFMLTAVDGQIKGGGGVDRFRIKIWDKATGAIVYDNQMGASDTADPTTAIGGGSIVIHK